jgi:hypothetical protein
MNDRVLTRRAHPLEVLAAVALLTTVGHSFRLWWHDAGEVAAQGNQWGSLVNGPTIAFNSTFMMAGYADGTHQNVVAETRKSLDPDEHWPSAVVEADVTHNEAMPPQVAYCGNAWTGRGRYRAPRQADE